MAITQAVDQSTHLTTLSMGHSIHNLKRKG
jgi:hypothetical protein